MDCFNLPLWDITVTDSWANSYIDRSSVSAGSAAELAAHRKIPKHINLSFGCCFIPLAFETLNLLNKEGNEFITTLGKRLSAVTGRDSSSVCRDTALSV